MATVTGPHPLPAAALKTAKWPPIAWFGILIIAVYFPILSGLVRNWATNDDMGHGFFVPVVAGYIVWQRRERLLAMEWKPAWWGIGLIVWGALQSYFGMLGAEFFLQRTSLLFTLVGVLLVFGGTAVVRELAFPLCLLAFMIPLPTIIYNKITFPLQLFASSVAENILNLINIPTLRDGNVLQLPNQTLNVAEACSGIRSLLSLTFLSLVYAYFFDRRVWMRAALFVATIPIAILANSGRVTITGVMGYFNPDLAKGLSHELEGWVIFLIALAGLVAVHRILCRIWKPPAEEPVNA